MVIVLSCEVFTKQGRLAQLVERHIDVVNVAGSTPAPPTIRLILINQNSLMVFDQANSIIDLCIRESRMSRVKNEVLSRGARPDYNYKL